MFFIGDPYQQGTQHGTGELPGDISGYHRPFQFSGGSHGNRNSRVQVCAAMSSRCIHTHKNSHGPANRDDDPSAVVSFCFVEHYIGHYAITQQDQEGGADQFEEKVGHKQVY